MGHELNIITVRQWCFCEAHVVTFSNGTGMRSTNIHIFISLTGRVSHGRVQRRRFLALSSTLTIEWRSLPDTPTLLNILLTPFESPYKPCLYSWLVNADKYVANPLVPPPPPDLPAKEDWKKKIWYAPSDKTNSERKLTGIIWKYRFHSFKCLWNT